MAKIKGVNLEKLQGGLGRTGQSTDNHVALITSSIPVGLIATAVNNSGKGVLLQSVYDAELLGINEAFDANNTLKLYDQIVEFFRLAPEAKLYLFNEDTKEAITTFINYNKSIKGYAINVSYDSVTPNLTTEVTKHQLLIDDLATDKRLIDFAVIGMDSLNDFTIDLFSLNCGNVSVCIGCEDNSGSVSTGSILGMIAVRFINENLGSTDIIKKPTSKKGTVDYTLTDSKLNRWLSAYITDGREIEAVTTTELINNIIAKGYIVVASYEGYPGFFFNNSYTCVDRTSDFAFIENNRTWNKAARIIRTTLLPKVKGVVKKNPVTGFIANTTASYWKQLVSKALDKMISDNEISGYEVEVNPEQVVNSSNPVNIKASIVVDGIVHEFNVAIGLTNNI